MSAIGSKHCSLEMGEATEIRAAYLIELMGTHLIDFLGRLALSHELPPLLFYPAGTFTDGFSWHLRKISVDG